MKGIVALILNMDLDIKTDLNYYWSRLDSDDTAFYRSVLSGDRFFQIFGMLHVEERKEEKKAKIQPYYMSFYSYSGYNTYLTRLILFVRIRKVLETRDERY